MGEIQHHISHLKPKSWFHSMAFLSVLVPGLTRVLALISVCRFFCSGRVFQFSTKKVRLQHRFTCAMWHCLLWTERTPTVPHMQTQKNAPQFAPVVPHNVHTCRNSTHNCNPCLPASRNLFLHTIPHCFLQSHNWLCSDPAHGPESETIKSSIYILPVSSHSKWLHTSSALIICVWFSTSGCFPYWFERGPSWKHFLITQIICGTSSFGKYWVSEQVFGFSEAGAERGNGVI